MDEIQKRFWAKVDKSGDCWIWTGAKDRKGYGVFGLSGKVIKAHRFEYAQEAHEAGCSKVARQHLQEAWEMLDIHDEAATQAWFDLAWKIRTS